jgi:protein-tyrosine kinase
MSRIHEALKKAEQDRATPHVVEVAPRAHEPAATPEPVLDEVATAAPAASARPASPIAPGKISGPSIDDLRFDDLRAHCAQPGWHLDPDTSVFADPILGAQAAEQFRTLRSRLYQLRADQTLRTILVTSAIPGEGKTWVTSNLAQAIVRQSDRRALIIDADLRNSRLHLPFGAPLTPGLSDYLKSEADEMKVMQRGTQGNLWLIAGGNALTNPSELLSNERMKTLLERVTPLFDWVIIDSPPCLSVADAGILAALCDGILVVMRSGETPLAMAEKARHELRNRNVIGVVLNAVEEVPLYSSAYHYGYGNGNGAVHGMTKDPHP